MTDEESTPDHTQSDYDPAPYEAAARYALLTTPEDGGTGLLD